MKELITLQNLNHTVSSHSPITQAEEIQNKRNYWIFPSYLIYK